MGRTYLPTDLDLISVLVAVHEISLAMWFTVSLNLEIAYPSQLKDEIQAMRDQFNIMYKTISDGQEYMNYWYDDTVRVSAIPWSWSDTMIACEDCYRTWYDWFYWIESFTCDAECASYSQGSLNGCMWHV